MEELIKITEYNGKKAVSARELHQFLEISTRFDMWAKRMREYGFNEGTDFCTILSESTGGRPSLDYALTLDTAKHWAMMQRNERGMQARQYFIEVEKRVNRPLSHAELLLQQCQMLVEQEKRLSQVEEKVDRLIEVHEEAECDLHELPISDKEIPEMSLRDQIRMLVNKYCNSIRFGIRYTRHYITPIIFRSVHIRCGKGKAFWTLLSVSVAWIRSM